MAKKLAKLHNRQDFASVPVERWLFNKDVREKLFGVIERNGPAMYAVWKENNGAKYFGDITK